MLKVSLGSGEECIFFTFHKVAAATAVAVRLNTARSYICAIGIDMFSAVDKKTVVLNF